MKTSRNSFVFKFLLSSLFVGVIFLGCSSSKFSTKPNVQEISNMLNSKRFMFIAERVNPLRGSSRILTSPYDVIVKPDTLNCYLPYFGRAYEAPLDPSKGGLDFKSHSFSYNITVKNKDEWQVYISPKDEPGVQQLYFQVFGNGTTTLNVVNTNRDPISFYGHIKKVNE